MNEFNEFNLIKDAPSVPIKPKVTGYAMVTRWTNPPTIMGCTTYTDPADSDFVHIVETRGDEYRELYQSDFDRKEEEEPNDCFSLEHKQEIMSRPVVIMEVIKTVEITVK